MSSQIVDRLLPKYTHSGMITRQEIGELKRSFGLSRTQVEEMLSGLIARGVRILDDDEADYIDAIKRSVSYQDRSCHNSLLTRLSLEQLMIPFLALTDIEREVNGEVDLDAFDVLPEWRKYLRALSRLRLLEFARRGEIVRVTEGFSQIQQAIHGYLDGGHVVGSKYNWRRSARAEPLGLARKTCESPFFSSIVLPVVREHFLSLPEVRKLGSWIMKCSTQPASMFDIVRHGVDSENLWAVWWLLLGDAPSPSGAVITDGSDICFTCLQVPHCTSRFDGRFDRDAIGSLLSEYQRNIGALFLRNVRGSVDKAEELIPELVRDAMLLKFAIDSRVVRTGKKLLMQIGVVDGSSTVLAKNKGQYCPHKDFWSLSDQSISRFTGREEK